MHWLTVVLISILAIPGVAQNPVITGQNQKFIHYDDQRGLIITEIVSAGMTMYSLSRKYGVSVEKILNYNPELEPAHIPIGFPINIPVLPASISFKAPGETENAIWLSYRVLPKETLYRISKVYLNRSPDTIIQLNPSVIHGLRIGQVLHIGWLKPGNPDLMPITPFSISDTMLRTTVHFSDLAQSEGTVIREQKGLAFWKPGTISSNFYVLHPTARVGSYMEITNPMLHRTITAKVSGNIPPGLYQSHVGLVVSPSTARALGVLDQQFFASWRFIE